MLISFVILSIIYYVHGDAEYQYSANTRKWFKLHTVPATWDEALTQCSSENAIIASPINENVLNVMTSLINSYNPTLSYYLGIRPSYNPVQSYTSIEGIPLINMPVASNLTNRDCLCITNSKISVVSCSEYLNYICYKNEQQELRTSQCGTIDTGYQLEPSTGSCYKVHSDLHTWVEAYSICVSEGGYLAILNDINEATLVKNMIPNINLHYLWTRAWDPLYIGFRYSVEYATYTSIHGDRMEQLFHEWDVNQPDNWGQLCGALTRRGKLDNVWCNIKSFFICEKDPHDDLTHNNT